jgi:hypothetical protein
MAIITSKQEATYRPVDAALAELQHVWETLIVSDGAPGFYVWNEYKDQEHDNLASPRIGSWPQSPVSLASSRRRRGSLSLSGRSAMIGRRRDGMRAGLRLNFQKERGRGFNPYVRQLRVWRPDPRQPVWKVDLTCTNTLPLNPPAPCSLHPLFCIHT